MLSEPIDHPQVLLDVENEPSQPRHKANTLVLHGEQTCITATRFVWTGVIFNSSKSSEPFQTVGDLKYTVNGGVQRGVRANPLNLPCLRA